jgi:hypothetical protein
MGSFLSDANSLAQTATASERIKAESESLDKPFNDDMRQ